MFNIPKKYQSAIKKLYTDEDGIWCLLNDGYAHGTDETKVIHCETFKELRSEFRYIKKVKIFEGLKPSEIKKVERFAQKRDKRDSRVTGYSYKAEPDGLGWVDVKCEICSNDMTEREKDVYISVCLWDRRHSFVSNCN